MSKRKNKRKTNEADRIEKLNRDLNAVRNQPTMLKRFDAFMSMSDRSAEDIVGFISVENAGLIVKLHQSNDDIENLPVKEKDSVREFVEYFKEEAFPNPNDKIYRAIDQNWPEYGPLVFRIADELEWLENERRFQMLAKNARLSKSQREAAGKLADYIINMRTDRHVTFLLGNIDFAVEYEFLKTMPRDELLETIDSLKDSIKIAISFKASSIIFRYIDPANKNTQIVNGFLVKNGTLCKLPKDVVKECMQLQPDGSIVEFEGEEYREPFIDLPLINE